MLMNQSSGFSMVCCPHLPLPHGEGTYRRLALLSIFQLLVAPTYPSPRGREHIGGLPCFRSLRRKVAFHDFEQVLSAHGVCKWGAGWGGEERTFFVGLRLRLTQPKKGIRQCQKTVARFRSSGGRRPLRFVRDMRRRRARLPAGTAVRSRAVAG